MRAFIICLVVPMLAVAQQATHSDLRDELLEMGRMDQSVRERMIPLIREHPTGPWPDELVALVEEQEQIDRANMERLEEIVSEFGWPGSDLVGIDASRAAQTILQHAELEQLRRLVPFLRDAVAEGQGDPAQLAMTEDQIRVEEGGSQIYGTEVVQGPDGIPRLYPIEDPDSVDERRAEVGLPPLDEYLDQLEQVIGRPIQR